MTLPTPQLSRPLADSLSVLIEASTWGLLIAIGALGLDTSINTIVALGWRHVANIVASTTAIFVFVTSWLLLF